MHWILIAHKLKFSGPWLADLCLKCLHATQPFLLEARFDQYERDIEFNLAASTGSIWTAYPWLVSEASDRRLLPTTTEHGILLAPGDCFDVPSHFRRVFAVVGGNFSEALDRFGHS
jgi:hypothetical protein